MTKTFESSAKNLEHFDAIIIGAGGAGLMCAIFAGRRKRKILLLDHNEKIGAKILISGGGRCNFSNTETQAKNFHSAQSHFCKAALSRFQPIEFIEMLKKHQIPFHEKKLRQLFFYRSARDIVQMLAEECQKANVKIQLGCEIKSVLKSDRGIFEIQSTQGTYRAAALVVATGGYSIPKIKATGFGFELARQFGLAVIETAPALDGFIFTDPKTKLYCGLSGLSIDCLMTCNSQSFRENLLFTHVGISGPAALQASLYWRPGSSITINLLPDLNFLEWALAKKTRSPMRHLKSILGEVLPSRFVEIFCAQHVPKSHSQIIEVSENDLKALSEILHHWTIKPSSTVGYNKAEVTRGGVDTLELSDQTMQSHKIPGLYFIGEVVDVTGWLGGFNFQWAWASGAAAGRSI